LTFNYCVPRSSRATRAAFSEPLETGAADSGGEKLVRILHGLKQRHKKGRELFIFL
jgi:hypothetical protein